jgi:hypothetical protein
MKFFGLATMAAVIAEGAWGREPGQAEKRAVTVCLNQGNLAAVARAKAITSQIFGTAGVGIDWHNDERFCAASNDRITITLSETTNADQLPGALAFAMPYDGRRIVVFYDRVLTTVTGAQVPSLLAHVLAHEITHMLQGFSRHSASGIMKAKWDSRDFADMRQNNLCFTAEDVALIHRGWTIVYATVPSVTRPVRP